MILADQRIDLTALRAALASRAAAVALALLGQPNRAHSTRRELRFGNKGSLVVVVAGGKAGLWHDHESGIGGDLISLIQRECGNRFPDAISLAQRIISCAPVARSRPVAKSVLEDDSSRARRALSLWHEAMPIAGTVAAIYLRKRGISVPPKIDGDVLRYHPMCPFGETRYPCMLAIMRDIHTNEPQAVYRTALTLVGGKIGRMALGRKIGGAIKLSADESVTMGLTIGEGVESVLSGMAIGFGPAWALGDAQNVRDFPVLCGIECLTILVDNDEANTGQRAALGCSARWTNAGREVRRVIPHRTGEDINDIICSKAVP
jgi:putative DNA primase/helicase